MSQGDPSEQKDDLRAQIALMGRNSQSAASSRTKGMPRRVAIGSSLHPMLCGGLQRGSLTEVVAACPKDAPATSGFALALAICFARETSAPIIWVIEDGAGRETGAPYAPGLFAHGLPPHRLVVVRTKSGTDTLWATEEALKCRAVAAVVTDLWRTKVYDLVASRRLVLAAGRSGTPGVLLPYVAEGADAICSAAQVRFEIRAAPSPHFASADHRLPLPGPAAVAARLARIRAGPTGLMPFDWNMSHPLVWDHEEACLRDALPLPSSSFPCDRSYSATTSGRHAA